MNRIDISIIITTKNEERHIGDCLRSIKGQRYPQERIEIIVVDNNSTDNTKEIASRFNARVYNKGPERSVQRNFGISKSRGRYILYLDADMILSKDVISECYQKCEKEGLIALYIPERIIGQGFWTMVRDFERSFYNATCIDAVRFVRKEAAVSINGFDESLNGPEDWDFDRRIKDIGQVGIIKSPLYHNEVPFKFGRYFSKKIYYSKNFEQYIQKWGSPDAITRRQLGFYYRLFGVFIEIHKWKKLLRHPLLTFGMYFLRILIGFNYLIYGMKTHRDNAHG
ncbi:MAG: glycosyltransferase [PVC group bacterium]